VVGGGGGSRGERKTRGSIGRGEGEGLIGGGVDREGGREVARIRVGERVGRLAKEGRSVGGGGGGHGVRVDFEVTADSSRTGARARARGRLLYMREEMRVQRVEIWAMRGSI